MSKAIVQTVVFKNTTPQALYELYMDVKKHSIVTGGPAKITKKEGAKYSVHGGYITGKNLQLIKNKLIVQSWRAADWKNSDEDSTFIINLEAKGKDTLLHAIHANVPADKVKSIDKGWHDHYWKPWKNYLAGKEIVRPAM